MHKMLATQMLSALQGALLLAVISTICKISQGCVEPLGIQDGSIPDSFITESSAHLDPNNEVSYYYGHNGRLDGDSFWLPSDSEGSWVQVDFGYPNTKLMNGIITQGSRYWYRWVEEFQVQYGNSTDALESILDTQTGNNMTFSGNIDQLHHHTIIFPETIHASILRIVPVKWFESVGLRFEILGCDPDFVPASQGACANAPCLNSGECVDFGNPTAHACKCSERFIGDNCETGAGEATACAGMPCLNNATCEDWDSKTVYFCHCLDRYQGQNCQIYDPPPPPHPCKSNPCHNGGSCHGTVDDPYCDCKFPYGRDWCRKWAVKYIVMVVFLVLLGLKGLLWCCYCCCKVCLADDEETTEGNDVKLEEAKATQEPMLEEKA